MLEVDFAAPQLPASQPSSLPSFEPRAYAGRFTGKLFTLCNPFDARFGFCLSTEQVQEIRMRYNEDRGHFQRLAIDALEGRDKALALVGGLMGARDRAILAAVLGSIGALLAGVGAGVLLGYFLPLP